MSLIDIKSPMSDEERESLKRRLEEREEEMRASMAKLREAASPPEQERNLRGQSLAA